MDRSTPVFPVLHYFQELAHTHVHWVGDAIQSNWLKRKDLKMRSPWITGVGPKSNDRGPYKAQPRGRWDRQKRRRHKKERRRLCEDGAEMEDASTSQDHQACQRPPEPGNQHGWIVPQNLQGSQSCQRHISHFSPPEPWDNTFMFFEAPDFVPICYCNPWKLTQNDVEGEDGEGTTARQENIAVVHTRGVTAPRQTVGMGMEGTKRNLCPSFHVWPPIFPPCVLHTQSSFIEHLLCAK